MAKLDVPAREPLAKAAPKPTPTKAAKETTVKAAADSKTTAGAKAEAAKKADGKKAEAKKAEAAKPKEPSRVWVQIAGGADKAAMTREFARLKTKAPKLLGGRTTWTTRLKATNRLLVGPFKTDKEAQEFVNQMAKADLSAFSWTSASGQEIQKLAAK